MAGTFSQVFDFSALFTLRKTEKKKKKDTKKASKRMLDLLSRLPDDIRARELTRLEELAAAFDFINT